MPRHAIDLEGQSWTVKNVRSDMAGWGLRRYFDLTNGTLTATEGFHLRYTYMRLWDGAKLVVPASCS